MSSRYSPTIAILNNISENALKFLKERGWQITRDMATADALLVRSFDLHSQPLSPSVRAIARAGVGINNIPIASCNEQGVVVFNTPGANANSVKELVIAGLLLSSRRISESIAWIRGLRERSEEIAKAIEQHKKRFAGAEIAGKTLGVIGLGAIGVMVSNAALALGMRVIGYDPFISVHSAWGLSKEIERAASIQKIYTNADWITIHVPLSEATHHLINAKSLQSFKQGMRLLNFARGELVDNSALIQALKNGRVACYVTDFPHSQLISHPQVITTPHLGASTVEAEENCARMAAEQLERYFSTGTIINSVNFPSCEVEQSGRYRLLVASRNVPNMVGQITSLLAAVGINIQDLTNRHRDQLAYNIIDMDSIPNQKLLESVRSIPHILFVRMIEGYDSLQ